MSQNITLLGASYSDVPAVQLPKTGGGTASFWDVSDTTCVASDVQSGKYFHKSDGTREIGTATMEVNFWLVYEFNNDKSRVTFTPSYADTKTAIQANAKFTYMDFADFACGMVVGISTNFNFHGTTFSECCRFFLEDVIDGGMYQVAWGYVSGTLTTRTYKVYSNVPTGTINITQNGTTDVSSYASANVQVPQTGTDFIVTLSWNSSQQKWLPDCTMTDLWGAFQAGKTISVSATDISDIITADGFWVDDEIYVYFVHARTNAGGIEGTKWYAYVWTTSGITLDDEQLYIQPSGNLSITQNGNNIDCSNYSTVSVNVSGGTSKNVQAYIGYAQRTANSYGATTVTLTVAKAGTYKVSWTAWRGSSSGTMGTNLHKNNSSGTNQQTWTGTYGQNITLNNQTYAKDDVLTIWATSGSNSRSVYVGNLIIEEQ